METIREVQDFNICNDYTFRENNHACGQQMVVFCPIVIDKIRLYCEKAKGIDG